MKSIKPGRGPSMMSGVVSIIMGIFGLLWTIVAAGIGGGFFALFGVLFIVVAIVSAVYNFKNATNKNRYSTFDIVDGSEEPDPLNERFGGTSYGTEQPYNAEGSGGSEFCPYCGADVEEDYIYCNKCGKKLP